MKKILNERGFDRIGGGMPDFITAQARQYRESFEKRLERVSREAKEKTRRRTK